MSRRAFHNPGHDAEISEELLTGSGGGSNGSRPAADEWDDFYGPPVLKGSIPPGQDRKPWLADIGKDISGLRPSSSSLSRPISHAAPALPFQEEPQRMKVPLSTLPQRGDSLDGAGATRPSTNSGVYSQSQVGNAAPAVSRLDREAQRPPRVLPTKPSQQQEVSTTTDTTVASVPPVFRHLLLDDDEDEELLLRPQKISPHESPEKEEEEEEEEVGHHNKRLGNNVEKEVVVDPPGSVSTGGGIRCGSGGGQQQPIFAKVTFSDGFSGPYVAPFQIIVGAWVIVQSGQRDGCVGNVTAITTVHPPVPPMGSILRVAATQEVNVAKKKLGGGDGTPLLAPSQPLAITSPQAPGAMGVMGNRPVLLQPAVLYARVVYSDGRAVTAVVGKHPVQTGSSVTTTAFPGMVGSVGIMTAVAPPSSSCSSALAQILTIEEAPRALQVPLQRQPSGIPVMKRQQDQEKEGSGMHRQCSIATQDLDEDLL